MRCIELGQTLFLYREIEENTSAPARDLDPSAAAPRERGLATLAPDLGRRLDRLARLAPTPLSIVLLGETGEHTGDSTCRLRLDDG